MTEIKSPSGVPAPPTTTPTQPEAQPPAPVDVPARVAVTGLPHVNPDTNPVQKQVDAVFQQAGLARTPDGGLQVKDTAALGKSAEVRGLSNFEQVYGTGENQLKPPGPPRVELTPATRTGAESFATNIDRALNDFLLKPQVPFADLAARAELNTAAPMATLTPADLAQAGTNLVNEAMRLNSAQNDANLLNLTQQLRKLPQAQAYRAALSQAPLVSASASGVTGTTAASGTTLATGVANVPLALRNPTELSADMLLAAFLKLNITDPNNSVETHNKMHEVMTLLRERAIKDAQQMMKVAQELRDEAAKDADSAAYVSEIMSTIRIIVCIIAIICMFIPGVNLLVLSLAVAIITAISMVVEASAQNKAANSAADASQASNDAKRSEMMAEQAQQQLQEESEIIKMILESKNKMVEAVMQMMNAMFGASTKLMSATMAKG